MTPPATPAPTVAAGRRGARAGLAFALAVRFLEGRKRHRLVGGTARAALAATVLGVAAMVVAMALMSGYRRDLRQKLIGGNAAVMAYPLTETGFELSDEQRRGIEAVAGVERWRRVTYGRGSLAGGRLEEGVDVSLRGVDGAEGLGPLGRLEIAESDPAAALAGGETPGVVLGVELARSLGVAAGDPLRLMVLGAEAGRPRFRFRSVHVAGTFESGLSEFDQRLAVLDREVLGRLSGAEVGATVFEFVVPEFGRTAEVAAALEGALGDDFLIRDWQELNAELFAALRLQQIALFFVLGLIVLVSTFNVASTLVVLVRERMREVGVLAALGVRPRQLQAAFLLFGGLISGLGTAAGVSLGALISWLLTRYELIRFDADVAAVYFLSSVSFVVRWQDVGAVAAFALAITLASCWLPARKASRVLPAAALRYE